MSVPDNSTPNDPVLQTIDFSPAVFDNLPAMVWMVDAAGRPIYHNRALQEFSGTSLEQMGACSLEPVHPEDRAECAAALDKAFREQSTFALEFRCRRADGVY